MIISLLIQAISAGVCLYAGGMHFLIGLRRMPRDRVHLSFALLSSLFGIYSLNIFALYVALDTGSLIRYVWVDRWGIATNYLAYGAFFWFIAYYTQAKRGVVLWVITSLYTGIALSNFILPYPWVYTDIQLTRTFPPDIIVAPWYRVEMAFTFFLLFVFTGTSFYREYRQGKLAASRTLGAAMCIFLATYLCDVAMEFGLVDSPLLQQYGFLAFIVIMSLRISGELVRSEKELRTLNIDLEHRVKQRTENLAKAKLEAEAANLAKSVFLASMSHELRTPLNAILGHTQVMSRDRSIRPEQHHSIRAINLSGDHLLSLINNVLEMSKIEAGRTILQPTPFSVDEMIHDVGLLIGDKVSDKDLRLVIDKDLQTISSIVADRVKIRQILINLLSNAVRCTRHGVITLRATVRGTPGNALQLVLEVEDTGEGIAPADLERIFDPFVQPHAAGKPKAGTGLGLAISRQYAQMMDGDLSVESLLGQGSIFRLKIPVFEGEPAAPNTGRAVSRRILGIAGAERRYRVLVVDDEPSGREVLIRMLSPAGFEIQEATGGQEAIDLFESWSPHLILMDIRMPDIGGIEAIQTIKGTERGQITSIIGVSASVFEEERLKVLESGADDFIAKPVHLDLLWEKIGSLLNVELVYEKASASEGDLKQPPNDHRRLREQFELLPKELKSAVRSTVGGGYMDRLAELAGDISDIEPVLGKQLLQWVEDFEINTINRIIMKNPIGEEIEDARYAT